MTTTTLRRSLAVAWTGLCLAAGIGIATMDAPQGEVTTAAVVESTVEDLAAADRMLLANAGRFVPDTDLTVDQAREVVSTANRVCDGLTAGVPMVEFTFVLAEQGLTDTEARAFVTAVAASGHCAS